MIENSNTRGIAYLVFSLRDSLHVHVFTGTCTYMYITVYKRAVHVHVHVYVHVATCTLLIMVNSWLLMKFLTWCTATLVLSTGHLVPVSLREGGEGRKGGGKRKMKDENIKNTCNIIHATAP